MAIIKDQSGLPSWFVREKYGAAERFKAAQWYTELNRRRELLEAFDYRLDRSSLMREDGSPTYEFNLWRLSWAEPTLKAIREHPLAESYDSGLEMPVRSVRVFDLMKQMDRDTIARREGLCEEERLRRWSVIADPEAHYGPNENIASGLVEMEFYDPNRKPIALAQIDLGATSKEINQAFKLWLKEAKSAAKARGQIKNGSKNDTIYKNWARNGLLPYLDLKMWMMETGYQIPHHLLNDAISKHSCSDSNLAKTTIELADRLMADLTQIRAMAAVETANCR